MGSHCSSCSLAPIVGKRYACCSCASVSLCAACFQQGMHPEHNFLCYTTGTARGERASRDLLAPSCQSLQVAGAVQGAAHGTRGRRSRQPARLRAHGVLESSSALESVHSGATRSRVGESAAFAVQSFDLGVSTGSLRGDDQQSEVIQAHAEQASADQARSVLSTRPDSFSKLGSSTRAVSARSAPALGERKPQHRRRMRQLAALQRRHGLCTGPDSGSLLGGAIVGCGLILHAAGSTSTAALRPSASEHDACHPASKSLRTPAMCNDLAATSSSMGMSGARVSGAVVSGAGSGQEGSAAVLTRFSRAHRGRRQAWRLRCLRAEAPCQMGVVGAPAGMHDRPDPILAIVAPTGTWLGGHRHAQGMRVPVAMLQSTRALQPPAATLAGQTAAQANAPRSGSVARHMGPKVSEQGAR
jgi:Zinc finger, ZZ type